MTKQLFPCRVEELPIIGGFIVSNAEKDLADFSSFSPLFTSEYLDGIKKKVSDCQKIMSSSVVTKELKAVTEKLTDTYNNILRIALNQLEGYLNLAGKELDIATKDFGLKAVRSSIANGNVEGIIANMQKVIVPVKRNEAVLSSKGMSAELTDKLEEITKEINALNLKQNELMSDRSRLTDENLNLFNDLWESLQPILKTGQALYKGIDPVKLKDYTVSQLIKRVNAEGKRTAPSNP